MLEYLNSINPKEENDLLNEIREEALEKSVPIITLEGINLINQLIAISHSKKILEIGTAVGYSALNMVLHHNCHVTTIERNEKMYQLAMKNIEKAGMEKNIAVLFQDALEVDESTLGEFDMIFIDAAKAQYIKFFGKYSKNLRPGGIIISDNLLFHGRITEVNVNRNFRQLMRKLRDYNEFLTSNPLYDTYIYNIGDGMAISIKK